MTEKKKSLRDLMPQTADLIDRMRALLGREYTDAILRKAMRGVPGCFYAEENGHTFGTPFRPVKSDKCLWISRDGYLVSRDKWMQEQEKGV